ncbi:MAG: hypothetical protein CL843_18220 [Crocinitomicaceae bacterium]|nr:hypothetical protein [Crocinitomicaceae bacterium]|tara:strand:+ start:2340 stop:2525 length:186 start_codon:yes stop_codon:yes gene_type:complete
MELIELSKEDNNRIVENVKTVAEVLLKIDREIEELPSLKGSVEIDDDNREVLFEFTIVNRK